MKQLQVILLGQQAGTLTQQKDGKISFRYSPSWLEKPDAVPLSQSLPLRTDKFSEKECIPFFGGLLPEEANRQAIAKNLGISSRNDYAMLREIGGECAGAVSLLPKGEQSVPLSNGYRQITLSELIEILDQLPQRPLLAGSSGVRLSLAGAQNKLALKLDDSGFAIPLQASPSTHILKPESQRFPGLAENEAFCLQLASKAGLNACKAVVTDLGPHHCLLIERYDRIHIAGTIQRLHQEDFCQALAVPSRIKYQNEGGPCLPHCFDLIRRASHTPAKDLLQLFNAVLFNYLIGNHDAHAKNFSLLYTCSQGRWNVRIAPFYDLISTAIYPQLTDRMAMKIGKTYQANRLRFRDWEFFWKAIGFSKKQAHKQTILFADKLLQLCCDPNNEVEESIQTEIIKRTRSLLTMTLNQAG